MTITLSGATRDDILAIPAVMLGFHPHDSCVALAMGTGRVEFCARLDLDWYIHARSAIQRVASAARRVQVHEFVVIGYGPRKLAERSVAEMVAALGHLRVTTALVVDGGWCWWQGSDAPPAKVAYEHSVLAAKAVYCGVAVQENREAATFMVTRHHGVPADFERSRAAIAALDPEARLGLLRELAEHEGQCSVRQGLELALLLLHEECLAEIIARLSVATAERLWNNLTVARAVAPPDAEPVVLAMLALASWLSGRPAAHTSCIEQLEHCGSRHPAAMLARRVYASALPPNCWHGWPGADEAASDG